MNINFCLIRDGLTSTSLSLDVGEVGFLQRWITSSIRLSGLETTKYHFIAYGNIQDISGTDRLEEISATVTGVVFDIVNKREITGSHLEFDLEKRCQS